MQNPLQTVVADPKLFCSLGARVCVCHQRSGLVRNLTFLLRKHLHLVNRSSLTSQPRKRPVETALILGLELGEKLAGYVLLLVGCTGLLKLRDGGQLLCLSAQGTGVS